MPQDTIADIGVSQKKKPRFSLKRLSFKKFRPPARVIVWLSFLAVVVVEMLFVYHSIYQNVTFKSADARKTGIVRINFSNYDNVMQRLNEVATYQSTTTIDFSGFNNATGRDNPFAEP